MCKYSLRWPTKIVACLHIVFVFFNLLIILLNFLLASLLMGGGRSIQGRSDGSMEENILTILFCTISAVLCFELYISVAVLTYATTEDAVKKEALQKCKLWLAACIVVLILFSGSLLIMSVHYKFMAMAWLGIVNVIIRGIFIIVVFTFTKELRREVSLDNGKFNELDLVYASGEQPHEQS